MRYRISKLFHNSLGKVIAYLKELCFYTNLKNIIMGVELSPAHSMDKGE